LRSRVAAVKIVERVVYVLSIAGIKGGLVAIVVNVIVNWAPEGSGFRGSGGGVNTLSGLHVAVVLYQHLTPARFGSECFEWNHFAYIGAVATTVVIVIVVKIVVGIGGCFD